MKHAWLIITHNEFDILNKLVSKLDHQQSDIFIHFDRKVSKLPSLHVENSRLFILADRIDVHWGSVSQIQCELALFNEAYKQGPYDYYHIISGTTLPLKPWDVLNLYFKNHQGKSILTPVHKDLPYQESLKVRRVNLFLKHFSDDGVRGRTSQFFWKAGIAVQRVFNFKINRKKEFYKASNWLSLTQEAVTFLLSRKKEILKTYKYSFCGDEFFIPSELMATALRDCLVGDENYLLHNISRSNASVFHLNEYVDLTRSGYLFGRKFVK